MARFEHATMIQRRQVIEDALAQVLEAHFDLTANGEGERCVVIYGCWDDNERLVPLWTLASEMEVLLQ